jgi:hypothetical protein
VRDNYRQPKQLHNLPWIMTAIYGLIALSTGMHALLTRKNWSFTLLHDLCPPAAWASLQTNNIFFETINSWNFAAGLENHTLRMNSAYIFPAILYGIIFYWLVAWIVAKAILYWRSKR